LHFPESSNSFLSDVNVNEPPIVRFRAFARVRTNVHFAAGRHGKTHKNGIMMELSLHAGITVQRCVSTPPW